MFVVPFLVSFLLGLLILVGQGFPLGEFGVAAPVFGLTLVSLLYIAVFFTMGVLISTYLDNAKTALIVAFTFWVLAVLIAPRGAFVIAKLVAPTRTQQAVYMEKTAIRNNLAKEKQERLTKKILETFGTKLAITPETQKTLDEIRKPINEEFRLKFQNQANKIDKGYQREKDRQEQMGEMLSRLVPTSSLIYSAINLTQTGKLKRDLYFQTGERYYKQLDDSYFSEISDDAMAQVQQIMDRQMNNLSESEEIPPSPTLTEPDLSETMRRSAVDVLLLGFFALAFTVVAFLKFFRSDVGCVGVPSYRVREIGRVVFQNVNLFSETTIFYGTFI